MTLEERKTIVIVALVLLLVLASFASYDLGRNEGLNEGYWEGYSYCVSESLESDWDDWVEWWSSDWNYKRFENNGETNLTLYYGSSMENIYRHINFTDKDVHGDCWSYDGTGDISDLRILDSESESIEFRECGEFAFSLNGDDAESELGDKK